MISSHHSTGRIGGMRAALLASLTLLLAGCASEQIRPNTHESLNGTLWVQTAAEYAASTAQAYQLARMNLDLALADPDWSAALEQSGDYTNLPPAILVDIDQTLLDTSDYNGRIVMQYGEHSSARFDQWCNEAVAKPIPGARDFVRYAAEKGVTIIYYSRRTEAQRECTTQNLAALGFVLDDQSNLLLHDDTNPVSKAQRRSDLASQFRILLLVGDDLDDFVAGAKSDPAKRREIASRHAQRWGRQWIILPNPMYGSWETSLYEFDYALPRDEELDRKRSHLKQ